MNHIFTNPKSTSFMKRRLLFQVLALATALTSVTQASAAVGNGRDTISVNIAKNYTTYFNVPADIVSSTNYYDTLATTPLITEQGLKLQYPQSEGVNKGDNVTRLAYAATGVRIQTEVPGDIVLIAPPGKKLHKFYWTGMLAPAQVNVSSGTVVFGERDSVYNMSGYDWLDNALCDTLIITKKNTMWTNLVKVDIEVVDPSTYVPAPEFSVAGGDVISPFTLSLAFADGISKPEGTKIYYTVDGTDPTTSATRTEYTTPITVSSTTTVKAAGVAGDYASDVVSETYSFPDVVTTVDELRKLGDGKFVTFRAQNLKVVHNFNKAKTSATAEHNVFVLTSDDKGLQLVAARDSANKIKDATDGSIINGDIVGTINFGDSKGCNVQLINLTDNNITITPGEPVKAIELSLDSLRKDRDKYNGHLVKVHYNYGVSPRPNFSGTYDATAAGGNYYGPTVTVAVYREYGGTRDTTDYLHPISIDSTYQIISEDQDNFWQSNSSAISRYNIHLYRPAKAGEWTLMSLPFCTSPKTLKSIYGEDAQIATLAKYNRAAIIPDGNGGTRDIQQGEIPFLTEGKNSMSSEGKDTIYNSTPFLIKPSKDVTEEAIISGARRWGTSGDLANKYYNGSMADAQFFVYTSLNPRPSDVQLRDTFQLPGNARSEFYGMSKDYIYSIDDSKLFKIDKDTKLKGLRGYILINPTYLPEGDSLPFFTVDGQEIKQAVKLEAPVITADSTFTDSTTVTITAPEGATINYATDGKTFQAYTEPIVIKATTTFTAFATEEGFLNSDTISATFTKVAIADTTATGDIISWAGTETGTTFASPTNSNFTLTITDTDGKTAIDKNTAYFGTPDLYRVFTGRLKSGGKSSDKNSIALNIPKAGQLKVYARTGSNGATDRTVVLTQSNTELYNAVVKEADAVKANILGVGEKNIYPIITVDVKAGTVTVGYPVGSINFYAFEFVPDDKSTDGINAIQTVNDKYGDGAWYSIQGIKLQSVKGQKGIFIHNGKKYILK